MILQPTISIRAQKDGIDFLRFALPAVSILIFIGFLLNARDPLKLPFYDFVQDQDSVRLKLRLSQTRLNQIDSSLMMYFYVHGSLPIKLDELVSNNYLRADDVLDPWGRPYLYDYSGDTYILSSPAAPAKSRGVNRPQVRRTLGRMQKLEPPPPKKKPSSAPTIRFENTN